MRVKPTGKFKFKYILSTKINIERKFGRIAQNKEFILLLCIKKKIKTDLSNKIFGIKEYDSNVRRIICNLLC